MVFPVRAVIFDIDDTLYLEKDYIYDGFSYLSNYLQGKGIPATVDDFMQFFTTNASDAIANYLQSLHVYSKELHSTLLQMYRERIPNIKAIPGVEALLQYLHQKNIPLGIISDGTPMAQNNKLLGLNVRHYFDFVVFSDALGGPHCRKPCDVGFRYIQKQMQIPFPNLLYIGDNADKDFYPVEHLGMQGIQYRNPNGVYYGKKYKYNSNDFYFILQKIQTILENTMPINITIDGPVGAGKSTVAKEVANRLGILHLDTGAMYRAFAYACHTQGVSAEDTEGIVNMLQSTNLEVAFVEGEQKTLVNGQCVNAYIRTPEISMLASNISKNPLVRQKLVEAQRQIASTQDVLLDGRDTGTNVLKNAKVKIFLTASAQERARRRFEQNGKTVSFEEVLQDLIKRDKQDMEREINPLVIAEDGILVDTTHMNFEESVEYILQIVREKYEGELSL